MELPVYQALKHSISSISLEIELKQDDIRKKSVLATTTKCTTPNCLVLLRGFLVAKWLGTKPKEYVDLQELWKERMIIIRNQFASLKGDAIQRIREDKDKLIDNYLAFLEGEFSTKFADILADLEQKVENQTQRENAIAQAKIDIDEIRFIKQELETILQF
ncbi:hypothetical protein J4727_16110 [Providencia rettgeri]|uniref:Uncharacterized protein n=1 Tax=Providencia rettgeri TaxID=587 RepID=A0A939NBA4_PRORE|nr:hypothetical protein [Providencia rettgeri]